MSARGTLVLDEDFAGGWDEERWGLVGGGPFLADDGEPRTSEAGLAVASRARSTRTGEPEITKEAAGDFGHLKWLATTTESFEATGLLEVAFRAGATCFGVDEHPFGDAVTDPQADIRLAAGTLNVLDFESGMVFDFWIANGAIYPFYERLKFPGDPRPYNNFASVVAPIPRSPEDVHDFLITFEAATGTATWSVDGVEVGRVEGVGPPKPDWSVVIDHGGTPEAATPQRFQLGLGLMTLLDASLPPSEDGLADVGTVHVPAKAFRGGPQLFGQGAELRVERVTVTRS